MRDFVADYVEGTVETIHDFVAVTENHLLLLGIEESVGHVVSLVDGSHYWHVLVIHGVPAINVGKKV